MASDHPNYESWGSGNRAFPYPFGEIDLNYADAGAASARITLTVPGAAPHPKTFAENSIGITRIAQLWFGIECDTDAKGRMTFEAVMRARHLHAFEEHGEKDMGVMLEIRIAGKNLATWANAEAMADHGAHCDVARVDCYPIGKGKVTFDLNIHHIERSVKQLLQDREDAQRAMKHDPFWKELKLRDYPLVEPKSKDKNKNKPNRPTKDDT